MQAGAAAAHFEKLFVAGLAAKASNAEFERIGTFVRTLKKADAAQACLQRFLKIAPSYRSGATQSRIGTVFYLVLKHRVALARKADKFIDGLLEQLTKAPLKDYFLLLSNVEQQEIVEPLQARKGPPRKSLSVLAELREAYRDKHHKDAANLSALLDFDPRDTPSLRKGYLELLKAYNDAYDACVGKANPAAFKNLRVAAIVFRGFLRGLQSDGLYLFQMLRYWRTDRVRSVPSVVDEIAYVVMATELMRYALNVGRYAQNVAAKGFTAEETRFILNPLSKSIYRSSYRTLIDRYFRTASTFDSQCDLFLHLHLHGRRMGASLATEEELLKIVDSLTAKSPEEIKALGFDLSGKTKTVRWHAERRYRIGQQVGTLLGIVFFEGETPHDVFVEFSNAPGVVYKVWIDRFVGFANNAAFDLVYEYNKHLVELIPAFFELLLYIPGIVEAGFIGLVRALIDEAVSRAAEEVLEEFGFDGSKAGLWVGGLSLLTHRYRPNLKRAPVRDLAEIELAEGQRASRALAQVDPRAIARTGTGDMATEARALDAPATPVAIVEVKAQAPASSVARQADEGWLARAADAPAAERRAAGGSAATEGKGIPPRPKKTEGPLEAEEYRAEPVSAKPLDKRKASKQRPKASDGGEAAAEATGGKGIDRKATASRLEAPAKPPQPTDVSITELQTPQGHLTAEGEAWIRKNQKTVPHPDTGRPVPPADLSADQLNRSFRNSPSLVEKIVLAELDSYWKGRASKPTDFLHASPRGTMQGFAGRLEKAAAAAGLNLDKEILKKTALDLIEGNPRLKAAWRKANEDMIAELKRLQANRGVGGPARYQRPPGAREKQLVEEMDEMRNLERGPLADKRPDAVEVLLGQKEIYVWDVTLAPGSSFHNFKTQLYAETIGRMLGGKVTIRPADYRATQIMNELWD